jgi:hypothetical protein
MAEKISFSEACQMDMEDIMEANAALDYYNELLGKSDE